MKGHGNLTKLSWAEVCVARGLRRLPMVCTGGKGSLMESFLFIPVGVHANAEQLSV